MSSEHGVGQKTTTTQSSVDTTKSSDDVDDSEATSPSSTLISNATKYPEAIEEMSTEQGVGETTTTPSSLKTTLSSGLIEEISTEQGVDESTTTLSSVDTTKAFGSETSTTVKESIVFEDDVEDSLTTSPSSTLISSTTKNPESIEEFSTQQGVGETTTTPSTFKTTLASGLIEKVSTKQEVGESTTTLSSDDTTKASDSITSTTLKESIIFEDDVEDTVTTKSVVDKFDFTKKFETTVKPVEGSSSKITFEDLKKELPNVSEYYVKDDVPYFVVDGIPRVVDSGVTKAQRDEKDGSVKITHFSPEGQVSEIVLSNQPIDKTNELATEKPKVITTTTKSSFVLADSEGTTTSLGASLNNFAEDITITDFEKEIPNIEKYYKDENVPYFIIDGVPRKIKDGETNIVPNLIDGTFVVNHITPIGEIKQFNVNPDQNKGNNKTTEVPSILETTTLNEDSSFPVVEEFDKNSSVVKTTQTPDESTTVSDESNIIFPDHTTTVTDEDKVKSTTASPNSDIQEDDSELDKTTTGQPIEEIVEGISIEELEKELPNIEKYITKNGIPYFFFNGVPKKVESGITEIIPNNEDGTFSIKHVTPEGEIKEIKFSPKPFVFTQDSESSTPSSVETTSFQSEDTTTVLPVDQVEKISFDDFEKEVPNVSEYYIKDGVPYFVINDKPTKIESGLTEVKPNSEDGSIKIIHTYPDGGVKEITLSAQPLQTTQGISTTVSLGETTPSSDAVVTTTVSQDAVTTTLSEGLILEDDEIEDIPELISFEDLVKELPKISKYYIHRGIPYFVINNKPHRVESGVTQVKPNDDGTLSIVNISPDGSVKEAKVSSDQLTEKPLTTTGSPIASEFTTPNSAFTNKVSTDQVEEISFEDFEKAVPNVSEYYIKDGVPYFVINDKPTKIESGRTEVTPNNEDESIKVTHTYPDGGVKEIILSAQPIQTKQGISTTASLGETTPSSDTFVTATVPQDAVTTTLNESIIAEDDKPEFISFEDLVKELPKVSKYYIHRGIPYFVINNKPHRVESGVTQVKPNDDGTLSIVNISPDGSVKEVKVSSDQLTEKTLATTGSPIASEFTTPNSVYTNKVSTDQVEEISFEDFEKAVPNVSEYYIKDGVPYFVINDKPTKIESGLTEVTPNNEDESIKVTHTYPDGGVKEIILSAQPIQTTQGISTTVSLGETTPSSDAVVTTTISQYTTTLSEGLILEDDEIEDIPELISFDNLELEEQLSNVTGYFVKDNVTHFVIDGKPMQIESGETSVVPNEEDGSLTITNVNPDGTVKAITLSAEPINEDSITTSPSSILISDTTKTPESIEEISSEKEVSETKTTPSSIVTTMASGLIEKMSSEHGVGQTTTTQSSVDTTKSSGSETSTTVKESIVLEDDVDDSKATSPSSTLISNATKYPEAIEEMSTEQGVGETTTTPSSLKTTLISGLIEEISTEQGVDESTTTLSSVDTTKAFGSETSTTVKESIVFEDDVEDSLTTSPSSTLISSTTKNPESIEEFSTQQGVGETTTTPSTFKTTLASGLIEKVSTKQEVGESTTTLSSDDTTKASDSITSTTLKESIIFEDDVEDTVTTKSVVDKFDFTKKFETTVKPVEGSSSKITFEDLKKELPNVSEYYVKDDAQRDEKDGSVKITHFSPEGKVSEIVLSNQPIDKTNELATEKPKVITTTTKSSFVLADSEGTTTSLGASLNNFAEDITITDFEKEIPNIEKYYNDENVPYFIIDGVPRKIKDGETNIVPNLIDGTFVVNHITPIGEIKQFNVNPDQNKGNNKTTEVPSILETTTLNEDSSFTVVEEFDKNSSVVKTTQTPDESTTVSDESNIIFPDTTTVTVIDKTNGISFKDLEREMSNINEFLFKDNEPYFIIEGKPKKIVDGRTQVIPDDSDGSVNVVHMTPQGIIKEVKLFATEIRDEFETTTKSTLTDINSGDEIFVTVSEESLKDEDKVKSTTASPNSDIQEDDSELDKTTTGQPIEEIVEGISIEELEKELPNIEKYITKNGIPYFFFNGVPKKVESGITEIIPNNEDGTFSVKHVTPEGEIKEINSVETTSFQSEDTTTVLPVDQVEKISFDDFEKEVPNVSEYYIKDGVPYFVINDKPTKIESGLTEVTPNSEDGSIKIIHTYPDGGVKEITLSAQPLQTTQGISTTVSLGETTPSSDAVVTTTVSQDAVTTTLSEGLILEDDEIEDIPELISFEDLVKELPKISKYYIHRVTPNDDETLSIVNISPDGSVKEAKVPSDQLTEETLTTTGSPNASEFTTPNSVYSNQVSTDQVQEISFEDFEKEVPNVSEYYITDGVPYFVINDKPTKIESGLTEVTPNNEDESIKVTHTYPDGGFSLGETTPSSDAVVTTTISQYTTTLSEGLISEDDKPELISFADLVKELPKVSQYYIHRGIPYFIINSKPHRVESGVTQVTPNDDGTLSIVNISPDGSVKEAKVSSDQLTEKTLTTTSSPIASESTTTFKTVTPNNEDESIKVTHTYPDGGVKEIILYAQPIQTTQGISTTVSLGETTPSSDAVVTTTISQYTTTLSEAQLLPNSETSTTVKESIVLEDDVDDSEATSPSSTLISNATKYPEAIEEMSTEQGVGETTTTPSSLKTMLSSGLIEEISTEQGVDESTTTLSSVDTTKAFGSETSTTVKESIVLKMITTKNPESIEEFSTQQGVGETTTTPSTFKTTLASGLIEKVSTKQEVGESTTTLNDVEDTVTTKSVVDKFDFTKKFETTVKPVEGSSSKITFEDLKKELPNVSEYYVKDDVPYFVVDGIPRVVDSGVTKAQRDEKDGSVKITHFSPEGQVSEIVLSNQPIDKTNELATEKPEVITTTTKSSFVLADSEGTTTSLGASLNNFAEDITITDFEKEIPNIEKYYKDENVPYFIIDGVPRKIKDGETNVVPNLIDGTFVVNHITPNGEIKQFNVNPDQNKENNKTTEVPSILETTTLNEDSSFPVVEEFDKNSSVVKTTQTPYESTTVSDESNIIFPDQTTTSSSMMDMEFISFDDLVKEIPYITEYFIKDDVPFFIISGKPRKIISGKTQAIPDNEDGSINVVHMTTEGDIKEIKVYASNVGSTAADTSTVQTKTTESYTNLEETTVDPSFVTKSVEFISTQSPKSDIQEDDSELDKTTTGQPIEEIVEGISIEELEKELPNIEKYITKNGIPYFFFNGVPKKVESGITEIIPNNEDGTFSIKHVTPEGEIKEIKFSPKPFVFTQDSKSSTPSSVETTSFQSEDTTTVLPVDQVEKISFDDFEKEVPNVSEYYIKDGVSYFVINDKPTKIESGLTEVKPNSEDGSIKIIHTYPDGGVKEITLSAQPLQTTQGISTTVSLGETTPSSDAVVTTTVSQDAVTTTLSEGLILEDDEIEDIPELISFEDLVKELPKISKYYIHRGIPYFVINNKPHRVESGVTQVKPNDDGTLSIVNISPDGIDYVTTDKNGIITNEFENKTSDAKPTNQISFEELEEQLSNVTGYFVKDNVTHFVIDGKPMQIESGETSVVPNEEDGSLTITNVNPDGTVKAITLSAEPINEDSITTSPSSILISDTTKTPESIEEISTEQGVGETKTTPSSIETTMASGLIEEISTEQGVRETTTSHGIGGINMIPSIDSSVLNMSTPHTVISDITQKDAIPISFKELKGLVPNITAYYVVEDIPYFVISDTPYFVNDGTTRLIPGDEHTPFTIRHTYPDGTLDEIALEKYDIVPGTVETGPNLEILTTESTPNESQDFPKPISINELEKLIPLVTSYYVLNNTPYFVIGSNVFYVVDGSTLISEGEEPNSLTIMHTFPNGTLYEIHLGDDRLSKKPINTTINELESLLYGITGYYVINGLPYFVVNGMTYYVDTGKTIIMPGDDNHPFTINHIFPKWNKFSTTPSTIDSNEGQIFSTTMKSDDGSRVTNTKETVEGFSTPSSNFHQSGDSNTSSPSSEIYEDEEKFEKGHSSTTPSTEDIQSTPGFGVSDLNSSTSPSLSETTDEDSSTNISITSTTSKTNVLEDESLTTFKSEDSEYISTSQPSVIDLITMTSSQVISDSTTTKKPIEDTTLDEEARPSLTSSTETISTTIINFISSTVKPLIKLGSNTEVPQKSTTEVPQLDISTTASVEENVFTVLPTGIISSNDSVIESSTEFASNEDKEHVFTVLPVDISSLTPESSDQFVDDGVKGSDKESTKELTSTTPSPVIDDASEDKKPSPIGGDYKTTKSPVFEDVSDAKISTSTVETRKEEEFSSTPAPSTITEKDTESEVVSEGSSNAFNDVSPGTLDDAQDISSIDKIAQSDDDTLDVNNEDSTTLAPEATTTYNAFEGNTKSSKEEESVFTVLPSKDLPSEYNPTTIIDLTTLVTTKAASSISSTERPEETVTTQSPTVVDLTTMKSTIISEDDTDVIIITTTVSPDITTTTTTTTTAAPSSMAQSTNDDEGTHTLNCQITAESCKTTDPTVPLNCKTGTSQPVTVLINKKDINLQEVIDKNLKIIVKEFMLMPMVMPTNGSSSKR
ncbi:unnamed protein product [Lepeophtheirus salmonis]|uniref:(salmon louse) hypothetical protein n=1 Tax=Lepeophtheirus salmonis TaxID=72036 RepID=A0A7R8CHE0_LEPSM|nr:unnamed protein product [Lepeophtheirus salmonis]CAF2779418.1 unnamed protein product [Lepeophtheirus salmonis]